MQFLRWETNNAILLTVIRDLTRITNLGFKDSNRIYSCQSTCENDVGNNTIWKRFSLSISQRAHRAWRLSSILQLRCQTIRSKFCATDTLFSLCVKSHNIFWIFKSSYFTFKSFQKTWRRAIRKLLFLPDKQRNCFLVCLVIAY